MAFAGSGDSSQRRQKQAVSKKGPAPKPNPPRKREPARAGASVRKEWRRRVTAIGELTRAMARVRFPLESWVVGSDKLFKLTIA